MKVFTKLMAAFALLAFLAVPLGMRGQTTVSYGWETSDDATKWTISDAIVATDGQGNTGTYAGKINTNHTYVQFNEKVYVTSFSFAFKRTSNNSNYNVYIETSTDGNTWTAAETYTMGSFSNGTYSTKTKTFDGTTEYYVRFHCYNTTAVRYVDDVTITYSNGGTPVPTTYTVTYDCNGGTSGCPENVTGIEGGTTINLADAPTKDGFDFDGWSNGNTTYNAGDEYTVNGNVTFTAQWVEQSSGDVQWVLTDLADLTDSDVFVIVGNNGGNYAMANDKGTSSAPTAVAVTVENDAITGTVAANIQWNISGNATEGYTFYPNGTTETWLYCTNTNNGVRVGTNANKSFVINSDYLYNTATSRHIGIYNSQDWRCYSPSASGVHSNIAGQTFAFYKKVTGGEVPPSISAANVEIAYYATTGSIAYTINNEPDLAGTLTASTESDWLTLGTVGETVPFTCTANEVNTERTATVTLTYTYGDNQAITKNVTVTQAGDPNAVNNISDITEVGANYQVKGMVVATNARGFIIGDGTGYVYTYLNAAPTQSVGDNLFISGTTGSYGHVIQFTNAATIDTVAETNYNGEPQPIVITEVPDYSEGYHLSTYLQFEGNLTQSGSNYEVAIGESKIRISYPTTDQTSALAALVNKTVRVHGFFAGISGNNGNSVFTAMMESVEDMTPVVPSVTVTPSEINAPYTETEGALAITYENIPELISFDYYFCDAEGNQLEDTDSIYPTWIYAEINEENETYTLSYIIEENDGEARTAYLKVYTFVGEDEVYAIVTINQEEYVAPTYAELPFAFNYGRDSIPGIDGLSQNGLGTDYNTNNTKLKFDGTGDWLLLQFDERPGTLTFDIKGNSFSGSTFTVQTSEDGTTYTDKKVYTELSGTIYDTIADLDAEVRYIKWIYTNKSSGNVGLGNITLAEYVEPVIVASITVTPDVVNVNAEEHDGTLTLAYENLTITEMSDFDIQYYNAEGQEAETPDWIEVLVAEQDPQIGEGYVVSYYMLENEGEARTAYFKVYAMDDETNLVHSNLVTINQEAYVAPVPSITITPATVNLDAGEHYMNLLDLAYENIEVEGTDSFTVHYYNAEGEEIELVQGEAWLVAGVVQQDDVYQVLFAVVANYGEARAAYFKVSCGETYSNLVTVTQAAPVLDYAVLPFVWEGGERSAFEALNGTSTYGVGDYAATQGVYRMKLDNNGDYIMVKTNGQPGLVTIGVKMVGGSNTSTITIQGSADGETFTDIEELTISGTQNDTLTLETTNVFDANDRYVRMLFTRGSNVGVGPITIAKGTAPSINIAPANFDLEAVGDLNGMQVASGFVTYNNIEITQASDFHIQFYNAEGIEQEKPEWILGAAVSQIANSYQVACMIAANNGVARSTYYKVYAFDADSIPVYSNLVTINQAGVVQQYTLTVAPFENLELITFVNDSMVMEADGQIQVNEGDQIMLSVVALEGYVMETLMVNSVDHVNDIADDFTYTFEMPAENVTISASAVEDVPFAPTVYTRATSITSGAHYIIVGFNGSDAYAMGTQNNNNRAAVIVSENGTEATVVNENVYDFVVETVEGTDYYSIYDARTPGYLYAASSSGNQLKTETELDNNGKWEITIAEDGQANVVAQGSNSRKYMRYNVTSTVFSCYAENSGVKDKVYFYVKSDEVPANEEITVEGTDFGTVEAPTSAGYNLIASPFNNVDPKDVAGMLSGNYDLYYFDQNGMDDGELKEWRNYKADNFVLKSGKGYLYSSENGASLNFIGAPYAGDGEVTLDYTEGNRLAGWNLIGNPFNTTAYLENNRPFYVLDETGSELIESSGSIGVMQGLFVKATTTGETVTFTTTAPQTSTSGIHANLSSGSRLIDRATICFGEGSRLPKFQLNPDNTKLYITEDNLDYAVVNSSSKGEMPVNFKASKNGTYTLSVNAENVEMNYLHLIDNITGDDVNLLATPNYTFEASTADYASRFRIVFSATESNSTSSESFAYFNGSTWMVSNTGEATLQVVDMMGRVLRSENFSGNAEINLNQAAGVYVLRLVNGENVRTQKIVVK